MKAINHMKSLVLLCAIVFFHSATVFAQEFPTLLSTSLYDYSKGDKGCLNVINYNNRNENKAYIFAANIPGRTGAQDLFRLTCYGTTSFNSPWPGYDVTVNFYNNKIRQGGIFGSSRNLYVFGHDLLALGIQDNYSLMLINSQKISCARNIFVDYNGVQMRFGLGDDRQCGWLGSQFNNHVILGTNQKPAIILDGSTQNVYVGVPYAKIGSIGSTLKSKYALFVQKGVLAEDYSIAPVASWSDRVFESGYSLRSLNEVETFISENLHLPDVPSAEEVAENGYSQHEMNCILLQKIEELTLYIIQQQKEIAELKARHAELK
ncbi:MAG: hypothetical protein NC250_01570 [Alistipes senegalensis]|nr:hypothetical protein [Bacteroides cellulosilyticus]MCM1351405.1 hypothetical protein [Alistipes senegalensis]